MIISGPRHVERADDRQGLDAEDRVSDRRPAPLQRLGPPRSPPDRGRADARHRTPPRRHPPKHLCLRPDGGHRDVRQVFLARNSRHSGQHERS